MAEKDYSVNINVGLNTGDAEKQLADFQKTLKKTLFGSADMKFAVGGYSMDSFESLLVDELKGGKKGAQATKKLEQIAEDFGDSFVEVMDIVEEKEVEAKKDLNQIARRYAEMFKIDFIGEFAKSMGEPDFMLPAPKGSNLRNQTIQDFIPGKGGMPVISPAMFVDAIEKTIAQNPEKYFSFGQGMGRGIEPGLSRGALNQGAFQSAIPEISDDIKNSIFDLIERATDAGKAEDVGSYLRDKTQQLLDYIFEIGYKAREGTFRSSQVSEGDEAADNLIRYADASARAAIAKAEEEFGLAIGTLAKHIQIAGTQYADFSPIGTSGERMASDPNVLKQVIMGEYNDLFTGTLMSMPDPRDVPDLMAQIFDNPAIIASGEDGIQKLLADLGKFIAPADTGATFNIEAYKSGLAKIKEEIEASGEQFIMAFDTEFNQKLPQQITEASLMVKDAAGKFREVLGFIQAPPASEYGAMLQGSRESGGKAVGTYNDLAKRAQSLGLPADIGAKDFEANFKQLYGNVSKLTGILQVAAELDIPVVGSNIQGADYDKLFKSVTYINEKIVELGLELPKLQYPIQQTLLDTRDIVNKAKKAGSPTAIALSAETLPTGFGKTGKEPLKGANVENILRNLVTQFPEALGANLERIELKPGGGFKIDGLDAHFARADNQAVLIITEAMSKFEDLVGFMRTKIAGDYQPKKVEDKQLAAAGGGSGGLDARRASSESADNAKNRFLTEKELLPLLKDLTKLEQEQVLVGIERLSKTQQHKKLIEEEKSLRQSIVTLEQNLAAATGKDQKREALKALIAEKSALDAVVTAGKKLETQKRDQIKLEIRGKDVKDKNLQTTAKQIDEMNRLRSTTSGVGKEIVGQLKEQAAAAKAVETQTKSLVNSWVTGRYALYDIGNAYAGVSRQLWQASRQIFNITQSFRSYQTAFTSVERAIQPLVVSLEGAQQEAGSLKNAFIELSEQIPVSFEEISRIATLGAQMGVSASGIVDFTKVVAQFSSVTGVAADTVAQKFGRIAELANVDYSEFTNLGSSILFAGMNAVATEPEIMTLAESIAAVSAQAGLVPSEIVGMATALASTGIQAEQARGVFTRVFADIDRAVSVGGKSLNGFANVAGMSSEEFRTAWGTDGASYEVFRAILGGLGATDDLTAAFDSLNIVETREVNTLTRLAENLNVVDQAISDANGSFESATFLGDTFEKTVDNLDAKIQTFNNNIKALTEELSVGMASSLGFLIDGFNEFLQTLKGMAENKLFAGLTFGSLAITAFGSAAALGVSAVAKLIAQIYAFRVAAINTANDSTAVNGIGSMVKQLTGWGGGLIEMRDQLKTVSPEVRGVITPVTSRLSDNLADSVGRLSNKYNVFSKSLKETDRVKKTLLSKDNIYLANSRVEADSINQIIAQRKVEVEQIELSTAAKSTHLARTQQEVDSINAQNAALAKQRASRIKAIGDGVIYIETVNGETRALTANQVATLRGVANSSKVSESKKAEAAARLQNITAINAETKVASKASKLSLGLGSAMLGIASGVGTAVAVLGTAAALVGFIAESAERTKINILESGGGVASLRDAIKQDTLEYQKLSVAQRAATTEFTTFTVKTKESTAAINPNAQAIASATGASDAWLSKNKVVSEAISSQTIALGNNTKEWALNAMMQDENLQNALKLDPDVLTNLEEFGFSFQDIVQSIFEDPSGDYSAGLKKALSDVNTELAKLAQKSTITTDIYKDDGAIEALNERKKALETTIATIESLGSALQAAIAQGDVWGVIRGMLGLQDAIEGTGTEADKTADDLNNMGDALRTVLDYASDLGGILSRVVELEFGKQISRDNITTGWREMAEAVSDAKKAIEDANNEIKGLTADKSILEYQLSVAKRYGDEARAAKIRAELAKINDQITDSEKKLADATAATSTSLSKFDDSEAAIKNRSALLGMVETYRSHIETLAKLGFTQSELEQSSKDLKRQFLAEAKALGFSGEELTKYADLFDQFGTVASDAPRNVDIEVALGLTAAEQAIKEFVETGRSTTVTVNADTEPAKTKIDTIAETKWKLNNIVADRVDTSKIDAYLASWLAKARTINLKMSFESKQVVKAQADAIYEVYKALAAAKSPRAESYREEYLFLNRIANGMASGGLVTGPGSGTSDSIPTMLSNGEYVVKASAVNTYGVDFFNALNQQRMGFSPAVSMGSGMSQQGPSMVFLSPEDRQLLRQFGDRPVNLYADSTKIAEVANAGNTQMSRRGSR